MKQLRRETKKEISILQDMVYNRCEDAEEKKIIHNLIVKLKNTQEGTISKSELAQQYGITLTTLIRRINNKKSLISELTKKFKYNKYLKLLMPAEVECIYNHLGIPPTTR